MVTRDLVQKCALATAFARKEHGSFVFNGQEVIGFVDLYTQYDNYIRRKYHVDVPSFDEQMEGGSDEDYRALDSYVSSAPVDENANAPISTIMADLGKKRAYMMVEDKIRKQLQLG
jgi:hypothetical protein